MGLWNCFLYKIQKIPSSIMLPFINVYNNLILVQSGVLTTRLDCCLCLISKLILPVVSQPDIWCMTWCPGIIKQGSEIHKGSIRCIIYVSSSLGALSFTKPLHTIAHVPSLIILFVVWQPARQEPCNLHSCADFGISDSNDGKQRGMSRWLVVLFVLLGLLSIGGLGFAGYAYYKQYVFTDQYLYLYKLMNIRIFLLCKRFAFRGGPSTSLFYSSLLAVCCSLTDNCNL